MRLCGVTIQALIDVEKMNVHRDDEDPLSPSTSGRTSRSSKSRWLIVFVHEFR
jgi:hypothetical protein